jgi:hypothetical protein
MVSLVAERIAVAAYPAYAHAVAFSPIAPRRAPGAGQRRAPVTRDALVDAAHRGFPEIAIPRDVVRT